MRWFAGESCDFRVVLALREAGHDVRAMVEERPGAPDREVLELAQRDGRILITEGRDFGQLVYSERMSRGAGVLYISCRESARYRLPERLIASLQEHGESLAGHFAVWTPHRLRLR